MNGKYSKVILAVCSLSLFLNFILLVNVARNIDPKHTMDPVLDLAILISFVWLAAFCGFSSLVVWFQFYKRMGWPILYVSPRWSIAIGICLVALFCMIIIPWGNLTFIDDAFHIPPPLVAISLFANHNIEILEYSLLIPSIILIVFGVQQKRGQQRQTKEH